MIVYGGSCRAASETSTPALLSIPSTQTAAEWKSRRADLVTFWNEVLGEPPEIPALKPEVLSVTTESDHIRELVRYQTEKGIMADAFVLIPQDGNVRHPAILVFHGTSSNHILQPAGLADAETRHLALHLVRRGYVALAPRCFIFGGAHDTGSSGPLTPKRGMGDYAREADKCMKRNSRWTGMGKMLWDGQRALDYLETRDEVDKSRIGCIGHSLGAKQVLYLTAFDERVKVGIFSEGGIGLSHSNWEAPWYLGNRIRSEGFAHDHHEMLAIMAPRPFLILGGGSADGDHTRPYVDAARSVYRLFDAEANLVQHVHNAGHDIPKTARDFAFQWLDRNLKPPPTSD